MVVQNIECQLSTVLMKRFLDGDNLPQEVLDDLEKHLRVCPTCQNVIDNEKVSLEEVLDGPAHAPTGIAAMMGKITGKAATPGGFVTAGPAEALLHASSRTYAPAAPGMAAFKNPKVLFLSGALALVLIAMSTILKNPSNLLGPKAAAVYGQTSEEKTAPKTDEHGQAKDETSGDSHETADPHAETTEHGTEETKPPEDTHAQDSHETDSHSTTTDESGRVFVNDPRVPGKPTVDTSDLIVAGGKNSETEHKEPPKTTTAHKPAPKTQTPKKNSGSTKRKPSGSTAKKPSSSGGSGSGIKVYDPSGKPIG